MKLHRIVGRAGMCGPSAMAAVTGIPTHDCAALLREVTGRPQIHDMWSYTYRVLWGVSGYVE